MPRVARTKVGQARNESAIAAVYLDPRTLQPWLGNPRRNHDVNGIARSIQRLGFGAPILARSNGEVIAGHGRLAAAIQLGLALVPVRVMADLSEEESHALALADNAYTDASRNDDAAYAAAIASLDEEIRTTLALPELVLPELGPLPLDAESPLAAKTCPHCGGLL